MLWPEVNAKVAGSGNSNVNRYPKGDGMSSLQQSTNGNASVASKALSILMGGAANVYHLNSSQFSSNPLSWSRDEVRQWLERCIDEYSFTDVNVERFSMNGKALALLNKEDFTERAPHAGAVLYNILQKLLESAKASAVSSFPSGTNMAENAALMSLFMHANPLLGLLPGLASLPLQNTSVLPTPRHSVITPPSTVSESRCSPERKHQMVSPLNLSDSSRIVTNNPKVKPSVCIYPPTPIHDSTVQSSLLIPAARHSPSQMKSVIRSPVHDPINTDPSLKTKNDCRLLWEFISKLLKDGSYTEYIRWENPDDFTFRIVNPSQLSKLWGIQKNRSNMTYEKLSRALRYYYRMDIIEKVPGKRLTYRFMRPPHEIKRGQRGAKPGVPRKARSTDDETDEMYEMEAMESEDAELSDDGLKESAKIEPYKPSPVYEMSFTNENQPIALVNHNRLSAFPNNNLVHLEKLAAQSRSQSPTIKKEDKPERDWNPLRSNGLIEKRD